MLILPVVLALVAQNSTLTAAQSTALEQVRKSGGDPAWVTEDGKEMLAIDFNGKGEVNLAPLEVLTPVYAIRIMGPHLQTKQLNHLTKLPALGLLVITTQSGVDDEGMRIIGRLSHLDKLDVQGPKISATGLAYLSKLKKLKRLYLYGSKLKDSETAPLETLTWLDLLDLPKTVSPELVAKLQKKLPNTQVMRDDT